MPEVSELGVLFVHGIGSQRRGDTLLDFGEPLGQSLTDWFGPEAVTWSGTELVDPKGGAPAHTRIAIDRGGERRRLLVAESTWADAFNPPSWWPLMTWLLWAVPFVVLRATDHRLGLVRTNQLIDAHRKLRHPLRWLANQAWRIVKNVASVAIVLVLTVVLLLLSPIALIPRVRAAAQSVQRLLIRYIGDSYDLVVSPGRGDAMVAQVESDLAWLESASVLKVAIVAHSQGAELVRRMLARRARGKPIASLITFGSGIAKLRAVERLHGQGRTAVFAYALRGVAAALTCGGVVLAVLRGGIWLPIVAVAAIASGALITGARGVLKQIVNDDDLGEELAEVVEGRLRRWHDYYATSDPVPEGALPLDEVKLEAGRSTRIANRRSPLFDHTSYFGNGEAFRPAVLAELATLLGWRPSGLAMRTIDVTRERRARATLRLLAARLAIGALAVAVVVLPRVHVRRRAWDDAARWLGDRVSGWLSRSPGRDLLLGAAIALAAALLYRLYAGFWNHSADKRAGRVFERPWPCEPDVIEPRVGLLDRLAARYGDRVDRTRGWDAPPRWLPRVLPRLRGTIVLYGLRVRLRQHNLYDTAAYDPPRRGPTDALAGVRAFDGTGTDPRDPDMGAVHEYFGRNGPAYPKWGDLPSPEAVSERLLARREFRAAGSLNLLAASWIQFEVHDWMQHVAERGSGAAMPPFEPASGSRPGAPRFTSAQTHWWDASQLYGADPKFTEKLRVGDGRIQEDDALLRTIEESMGDGPAPVPNLWLGLALFHVIFAREHNAICRMLVRDEPRRGFAGKRLFDQARLINAAVMAKVHTVEWTPALIAHPTSAEAIRASWWGELGETVRKLAPWLHLGDVLSGIPGSRTHLDGVRYSLTEEFVAVYRMHPLIPDEVRFRDVDGEPLRFDGADAVPFERLAAVAGDPTRPRKWFGRIEPANAIYSLAVNNPGAISLHNYPNFLRALEPAGLPKDTPKIDLAARDIARMRETAVPRYNDFRRMLRLQPCDTFEALAGPDKQLAAELRDLYASPDHVDLMVGLFAERKPEGFAFSDTAFRIFLLMAARRLRSDRFFTDDFNNRVYTRAGMRWIRNRTLAGILREHFPTLAPALANVKNVFEPWPSRTGDRG
jgi:hypothetical protein